MTVEGEASSTLRLTPIDDLGIEEISADRRPVPMGGSIAIPPQIPSVTPGIDGVGHEGGATIGRPLSPSEFEIVIPNWTPCTRFTGNRLSSCFTASDIIVLTMSTPFVGGFGGAPLIRKSQRWPLRFEFGPECCLP